MAAAKVQFDKKLKVMYNNKWEIKKMWPMPAATSETEENWSRRMKKQVCKNNNRLIYLQDGVATFQETKWRRRGQMLHLAPNFWMLTSVASIQILLWDNNCQHNKQHTKSRSNTNLAQSRTSTSLRPVFNKILLVKWWWPVRLQSDLIVQPQW